MTKEKKKEKRAIPLRASGESIVKDDNRPSKLLFDLAIEAEKEEFAKPVTTPYRPLPPPTTRKNLETSPKRDYTKVANSINRDAVPSGLFKGTSKNTYDVLYQKTRGAISPTRYIKAIQSDLLVWTNLSHNTLRSHLKHLQSIGLVEIHYKLGDNKGAEYEVFLPEEINLEDYPYHPPPPPTTPTLLNLAGGTYQNVVEGGGGVIPIDTSEYERSKTSFKDNNTNDDEAFAGFIAKIQTASEQITGKKLSRRDSENLEKIADLLILELKIAANRTHSISSVPAFLTEILRRKLLSGSSQASYKPPKLKADVVGKPNKAGEYEKRQLGEQGREATLLELREFAGEDFLEDFRKWYTEEDWSWLTKELDKIKPIKKETES